ncbi:uncharacterized protein LOC115442035 [Manduca sexta]|uniref:uncharacterized protein LOC115442035 n=1 Tax=Manduca sexta TaxID=7130 RepID=UPI00188E2DD3|nr:uncharacterized protein LOC115442035 [Manduca sexta]
MVDDSASVKMELNATIALAHPLLQDTNHGAMAALVLCIIILYFQEISCRETRNEGFINKISNGMKMATDFLGSESVALKVAEFVVRAFQTTNNQPLVKRKPSFENDYDESVKTSFQQESRPDAIVEETPNLMTPLKHLVRLFGLQPNQISAVAVNALVFVAQMISTFLAGPKRPVSRNRSEDHTAWILNKNSRKLQDLLSRAKNESLSEDIEELIKQQGSEEETSCIRLLVCKITPFVNRMQKAVFGRENQTNTKYKKSVGVEIMYRHLPTEQEINNRSDICERRHKTCNLNE